MIEKFRGEYNFLSNFHFFDTPMVYGGLVFKTNEHFYVAMKTLDLADRYMVSQHPNKGLKSTGRVLTIREDWDDIKLDIMLYGLRYKFSTNNPTLRNKLIGTGDQELQEGNWWNDTFWGVCLKTGVGENNLGKLLMQVREEIQL